MGENNVLWITNLLTYYRIYKSLFHFLATTLLHLLNNNGTPQKNISLLNLSLS